MSKWITGKDVARRLNLKDFQIFDYLASGELQPYSSVTGKKIKWYDFNRHDHVEANNQKSFFNNFLFLKSDIESFELAHGTATKQAESIIDTSEAVKVQVSIKPKTIVVTKPTPQIEPSAENKSDGQIDTEGFIRSLAISYLSDDEVIIKIDRQKPKSFTRKEMGFENSKKTWPLFIKVLTKGDFNVGIYDKNKNAVNQQNYNRLVKFPANFSKKFIAFLNKAFSLSLDSGVNIFQNMKGIDRAGTYKPKFQILKNMGHNQQQDINSLSKKETLEMIEKLSQERNKTKDDGKKECLLFKIGNYAAHAKNNGWLTEEQLKNYLSSPDDESSEYDAMLLIDDKSSLSIIKE